MPELASSPPFAPTPTGPRRYLPGMGRDWLLPLYDPLTRLIGIESAHRKLAEHAKLDSAQRVLEIGCGTANLALLVKRMRPQLEVVGLDPDPKALARAASKARRAGLDLELDRGFADQLPYSDATFAWPRCARSCASCAPAARCISSTSGATATSCTDSPASLATATRCRTTGTIVSRR
jgi:SAM-dependent methyltransferase